MKDCHITAFAPLSGLLSEGPWREFVMTAMIVDALGVRPAATATAVRERAAVGKFFWLDIFGGVEAAPADILNQLGLKECDIGWAQRFGQTGRMTIGGQTLRATTWMATPTGALLEVHFL